MCADIDKLLLAQSNGDIETSQKNEPETSRSLPLKQYRLQWLP